MSSATIVFTAKSVETILDEGGTCAWRLDPNHARQCDFAVCTRNAHNREEWAERQQRGPEAHRAAFLIGKVKGVRPAPEPNDKSRYLIQFSEYAQVNIPDVWKGWRTPVRYSSLEELGIDPSTLKWERMPKMVEQSEKSQRSDSNRQLAPANGVRPLTMAEAKEGLALTFGVPPEAIEITIRG